MIFELERHLHEWNARFRNKSATSIAKVCLVIHKAVHIEKKSDYKNQGAVSFN